MEAPTETDTATLLARLIRERVPNESGTRAWESLLRAHAGLMRRMDSDLRTRTGRGLNDFDVLATLANGGGSLRMSDLAERAYSSRSGMTRRVDRLVEEGMLCRSSDDRDGRGVVVALTDKGVTLLNEIGPAHLDSIAELFVDRLSPAELAQLESILSKIVVETTFG
jgi:DNA-binding MarR family transcriptional regulator